MAKRIRSKNITDSDVEFMLVLLDKWQEKLTWDRLIDRICESTGQRYSRATLNAYDRLTLAFQLAKVRVSGRVDEDKCSPSGATPGEASRMREQIDSLRAERDRLKTENNNLLTQFTRWAYNAHNRGLTLEYLNRPLPETDRGVTKERRN